MSCGTLAHTHNFSLKIALAVNVDSLFFLVWWRKSVSYSLQKIANIENSKDLSCVRNEWDVINSFEFLTKNACEDKFEKVKHPFRRCHINELRMRKKNLGNVRFSLLGRCKLFGIKRVGRGDSCKCGKLAAENCNLLQRRERTKLQFPTNCNGKLHQDSSLTLSLSLSISLSLPLSLTLVWPRVIGEAANRSLMPSYISAAENAVLWESPRGTAPVEPTRCARIVRGFEPDGAKLIWFLSHVISGRSSFPASHTTTKFLPPISLHCS